MFYEILSSINKYPTRGRVFVWHGESGVGKTEAALSLHNQLRLFSSAEREEYFRAIYHPTAPLDYGHIHSMKQLTLQLLSGLRDYPVDALGRQAIHELTSTLAVELRRQNVRLMLIDDAHLLPQSSLRAVLSLRNTVCGSWPLSLIFIGCEELHHTISECRDISRHVSGWYSFETRDKGKFWVM